MYKIFVLLTVCCVFTSILSCGKKLEPDKLPVIENHKRTAIVTAATNLVLRAKPERTAVKLGSIPHGSVVEIIQEGDAPITIDGITAKWYHVSFNGSDGWAFGGYLEVEAEKETGLKEEDDFHLYVGRSFGEMEAALKKRTVSSLSLKNDRGFYALEYPGYYILLLTERSTGSAWRISDSVKLSIDRKKERLFFPGGQCTSGELREPILAVAAEPGKNCEYDAVSRAWTVDSASNRFSPAMPDGIHCKADCCGSGCN